MPSLNKVILRNLLYIYVIIVLLLVILPLNSATTANDVFVLKLRADYLFHIIMFLPWMFFHKAAPGNHHFRMSNWPFTSSHQRLKTKDQTPKTKDQTPKTKNQTPKTKNQQLSWLLTGLFFAAGAEGLQYFLPWRAFNVNDLLANGLGVLLSLLSVKLMKISNHWGSKVKL